MRALDKEIIKLAWPAVLQTLVRSSVPVIDTFWIGKLGSEYLAAMTVASFLSWAAFALGSMMPIGTNALVAQSTGAKQTDTARNISTLNLINAFIYGVLITSVLIPLLPSLFVLSDLDASKSILAYEYLIPMLIVFPALTLFETGNSIYRGKGDTQTPFRLLLVAVVIKLTLTPILIFGWYGFPRMEMAGAPAAFGLAYGTAYLIGFIFLKKRKLINPIYKKVIKFFRNYAEDKKITMETIRIGIPLSLEGLAFVMIYVFVSRYVSDFGTVGLAALGIGHRSEAIPYQVGEGFSVTASILVGQNVGAKAYDKAEKAAWRVLLFSWVPMLFYGLFLFFYASEIAGFFTTDTAVIETAAVYNRVAAFGIFFAASESVFTGSFAGAGNSLPPLFISLPITAMRIPISAIFAPIYGMNGIWLAIFSTSILKGIIFAAWFKKGNWKRREFKLDSKKTATGFIEKQSESIDSKLME